MTTDVTDITNDDNFHVVLNSQVHISSVETLSNGHFTTQQKQLIDHMMLASQWMIAPEKALLTVNITTQRGVRTCVNPTLSRLYPMNDRLLRFTQLPHYMFTDTLVSGTKSSWGNKYSQVFTAPYGWTCAFPMKRKGNAHEALSLLFHRNGIPPAMVIDGSKEQMLGDFMRKLKEADCHLQQTEPYSPWMNAAESAVRELKRGVSQKIWTRSPKVLWDHCIELEALIRSHLVTMIYVTNGQVPEMIMTGTTADISHISEFGWYDWVMFWDNTPTFPEDSIVLGRYLGPATDVGGMMTAKILKENGQFVY